MVVTTSPLVKTYTLQEFWELPEPGDHSKLELIKGVLYMSPPPAEIHDEAFNNLTKELVRTLDRTGYRGSIFAPRAALWIDEDTYLEPDLMYVSDELKAQMTPGRRTRADIVVEIVSPSNAEYDLKTKSDTYRAMGVHEMWLIELDKKEVAVRSFEAGKAAVYKTGDILRSEVLPKKSRSLSLPFFLSRELLPQITSGRFNIFTKLGHRGLAEHRAQEYAKRNFLRVDLIELQRLSKVQQPSQEENRLSV